MCRARDPRSRPTQIAWPADRPAHPRLGDNAHRTRIMLSSTAHSDLEIRIVSRAPDAAGRFVYQVELTLDHAQESPPAGVYLDHLTPWDPAGVTTREEYGTALFEA